MPEAAKTEPAQSLDSFVAHLPEVLVVEDETSPRKELRRTLTRRGFRVREASSYGEAIQEAKTGEIGVVLMDLVLGDGPDGITTMRQIQQTAPSASVIFVSAYAHDSHYKKRAQEDVMHIGGWIEKPIRVPDIPKFVDMITSELVKVKLRELIQRLPKEHRAGWLKRMAQEDSSISPEVTAAILDELDNPNLTSRPLPPNPLMNLSTAIDSVYDEMRNLIISHAGGPGLREALRPLRKKLHRLQEREAEEIAKRYDARFRPLYDKGQQLISRARQLLDKP